MKSTTKLGTHSTHLANIYTPNTTTPPQQCTHPHKLGAQRIYATHQQHSTNTGRLPNPCPSFFSVKCLHLGLLRVCVWWWVKMKLSNRVKLEGGGKCEVRWKNHGQQNIMTAAFFAASWRIAPRTVYTTESPCCAHAELCVSVAVNDSWGRQEMLLWSCFFSNALATSIARGATGPGHGQGIYFVKYQGLLKFLIFHDFGGSTTGKVESNIQGDFSLLFEPRVSRGGSFL